MFSLLTENKRTLFLTFFGMLAILCSVFFFYDTALAQTPPPTHQGGGFGNAAPPAANIGALSQVGSVIGGVLTYIGSFIAWLGGEILYYSIDFFILKTHQLIGNTTPIGNSINTVWTLIRDICNLAFIAGFIYVGIRLIIDADSSSARKTLASIIIAAFLINFSLLISKLVVDVGNYVAVEIYNVTMSTLPQGANISSAFGEALGLPGFYKLNAETTQAAKAGANFAFYFMACILLIVAGFVLAAGGILLMIRFVVLVLILCFSPLLFAATIFPATGGTAKELWKKLISYSLFAPAYLLMLVISLFIMKGVVTAIRGRAEMGGALQTGAADQFGVVISFGVAIFFLILSLQVSQKFGMIGADKVTSYAKKGMGAATVGMAARLGRTTAGRAGNWISDRSGLKDAASRRGPLGTLARGALKGSRKVADSSFDARKVAGIGATLGIGEGAKGGYQTVLKEHKEKEEKFARSLGTLDDDDVQVAARKKDMGYADKTVEEEKEKLTTLRTKKTGLIRQQQALPANDPKIAVLQADINTLDRDIAAQKDTIKETEEKAHKAKVKYESEKQRRILGSTYAEPKDAAAIETAEHAIKGTETEIKDYWNGVQYSNNAYQGVPYGKLQDSVANEKTEKAERRKKIAELQANLYGQKEELTAVQKKNIKDRGYAGVLEKSLPTSAWPFGKSTWDVRKAGKEMRKNASKGLPKEKDDHH